MLIILQRMAKLRNGKDVALEILRAVQKLVHTQQLTYACIHDQKGYIQVVT